MPQSTVFILIHFLVQWQPTQPCIAIILQFKKKKKLMLAIAILFFILTNSLIRISIFCLPKWDVTHLPIYSPVVHHRESLFIRCLFFSVPMIMSFSWGLKSKSKHTLTCFRDDLAWVGSAQSVSTAYPLFIGIREIWHQEVHLAQRR